MAKMKKAPAVNSEVLCLNRCKLIKPVPVMGRALPAGMVVDAPDSYKDKLVSEGKAVWVEAVQAQNGNSGESPVPVSAPKKRAGRRKVQ